MDDLTLEELWEMGFRRDLTPEDLERLGLARKGKWQYTIEDIEALPKWIRAELIDGERICYNETKNTTSHPSSSLILFFHIWVQVHVCYQIY